MSMATLHEGKRPEHLGTVVLKLVASHRQIDEARVEELLALGTVTIKDFRWGRLGGRTRGRVCGNRFGGNGWNRVGVGVGRWGGGCCDDGSFKTCKGGLKGLKGRLVLSSPGRVLLKPGSNPVELLTQRHRGLVFHGQRETVNRGKEGSRKTGGDCRG